LYIRYDGKAIGAFITDALQGHAHSVSRVLIGHVTMGSSWGSSVSNSYTDPSATIQGPSAYDYGDPRVAAETRSASTSVYVCITY
jgi:hypothetical protein